jgi:MATE family multidrug resistance protein
MWIIMLLLGAYMYLHPRYRPLGIFARIAPPRPPVLREIVTLGWPISITITAEAGLFSAVSILMGTRGAAITAAHQIALNFASTLFMIPLALSSAITIRSARPIRMRRVSAASPASRSVARSWPARRRSC